MGRLNVLIDVQAFHAVAHGAEADAQKFGGLGTVVTGLLQGLFDDAAFHLVEVILYLHGARIKRRNGAVIERGFARVRFGDVVKRKAAAIGLGLRGVLNLQVVHLYHLADRQCNGAFEDILQLAEVAGIAVMLSL